MSKMRVLSFTAVSFLLFAATFAYADIRKSVRTSPPSYPAIALKMKIEGTVKLDVTIDADGTVSDVKVVSGHQLLVPAAVDAVKKWKYEPAEAKSVQSVALDFALPH